MIHVLFSVHCISSPYYGLLIFPNANQRLVSAIRCVPPTTTMTAMRPITTTAINWLKGPKGIAPKEQIAKMWYKPKRPPQTEDERSMAQLHRMHLNPPPPRKKKTHIFNGQPFAKGVVLKTLVRKPRKPNSANRKCVLVRLSIGREMIAYVPGEGHNLQEHNIVLCKIGRLRDTPGVRIKCVRGAYDLPHVKKKE